MARILAVDDNRDILDLIRRAAEADGHQVETASTAAGFMVAYSRLDPEVVLLDVVMPGMDGIELIRWLVDIQSSARIIVMSGDLSGPYTEMAGALAKANGLQSVTLLPKPFRVKELCSAIRAHSY